IQDFISIPLGEYIKNYLKFGEYLTEKPLIFGVNYFLKDINTGEFLNERKDKHVWVKWMALRVNNEAKARKTPTGLIPLYEDIEPLFREIRGKVYTKGDYEKQFTIRVPENLMKIERVWDFWKELPDVPNELFNILQEQKERLLNAQKEYGNYIPPEVFEIV
ncbi:MAG: phosphoenolpyruvate carboxykinase domain-containing protein, partial [Candidatus Omnitrophica bacterium]|nr:phosphoenolpyruvate carboxykinase domain-containing protein [Candidatus Omnitrophota bacterium]